MIHYLIFPLKKFKSFQIFIKKTNNKQSLKSENYTKKKKIYLNKRTKKQMPFLLKIPRNNKSVA